MENAGRLQLMIEAAQAVLVTLTEHDFFSLISFSKDATPVVDCTADFEDGLVRATSYNKAEAKAKLAQLKASGGTNYEAGFRRAFDVLDKGRGSSQASKCRTAILFLTDGARTQGSNPVPIVSELNTDDIGAHVFTYALGDNVGSSEGELVELACQNRGAYSHIADGGNLIAKMGSFYQVVAAGLDSEEIVWSTPYPDSTGLIGRNTLLITLSLPVYARDFTFNGVTTDLLLGVMGLDVMLEEFSDVMLPLETDNSYGFLVDKAGAALSHPRLDAIDSVDKATRLDVALVETETTADQAKFEASVRPGLISGTPGNAKINIDRTKLRGGSGSGVEVSKGVDITYYWQAAGPFVVSLAHHESDTNTYTLAEPASRSHDSWYHRLPLYQQSVLAQGNVSYGPEGTTDVTWNTSTYFLPDRAFEDPFKFSQTAETRGFVNVLHDYMNRRSQVNAMVTGGSGVRAGVRAQVDFGAQHITPLWLGAEQSFPDMKVSQVFSKSCRSSSQRAWAK
jgi:von Willebrand factor type A domain